MGGQFPYILKICSGESVSPLREPGLPCNPPFLTLHFTNDVTCGIKAIRHSKSWYITDIGTFLAAYGTRRLVPT